MTSFAYRVSATVLAVALVILILRESYSRRNTGAFYYRDSPSKTTDPPRQQETRFIGTTRTSWAPDEVAATTLDRSPSAYRKRLPDVLLIGVMKCGTGAIKTFLSVHPNMSVIRRETNFFSNSFHLGLESYRSMMPKSLDDQLQLEGSPSYFRHSGVPKRVHETLPDAKLLLVVCDPVERVSSNYVHDIAHASGSQRDRGFPPIEKYIFDANGSIRENVPDVVMGRYWDHLKQWLIYYPLSRVHVIDGHVIKARPWEEFRRLGRFLNIPMTDILDEGSFRWNSTRRFYCHRQAACLVPGKGREHPKMKKNYTEKLREYYRPMNRKFFELVGKNFDWP